jgi:hypothetical protein
MDPRLPMPTSAPPTVAKLTTGVFAAATAIWFPPGALAGLVLTYAIDKFVERPESNPPRELKAGNVEFLSAEHAAEFVPMAYKFYGSREGRRVRA